MSPFVSRLFYPVLFGVTAALAATLWLRHGLSVQWLAAVGARVARAQSAAPPPPAEPAQGERSGARRSPPSALASTARPLQPGPPLRRRPSPQESLEISPPVLMQSSKIIARIGKSEVILAGDVMPRVEAFFKEVSPRYDPAQHEQLREHIMQQVLQHLIDRKLIVQEIKKSTPPDKIAEHDKQLEEIFTKHMLPEIMKRKKVKTKEELAELLKRGGSTFETFKREQIEDALISEWTKKEADVDQEVTHEQTLRYYHEHFDDYKYPAKARFEVLHASFKKHRDRQEAWRLICDLGNEVARGRSFADVAKARSEGLHADRGGAWDWTTKGSLRSKAIDEAVFSLPVGRLSAVLEDAAGFSIVRVVERTEAGVKTFRETQSDIRKTIKEERQRKSIEEAHEKFLTKARQNVWTIFDDQPQIEQATQPRQQPLRR